MTSCATEGQLSALLRGTLSEEEAAQLRAHASTCPSCYAQLLRGDKADTADAEGATGKLEGKAKWAELEATDNWQPGRDLGRYVILLTLGKGGMGVVYRAYDKELDRAVALKVLHPDTDELGSADASARLVREAQAMARLSHPNVVAVHDVVVLERRVCVVMELVDGATVREWLRAVPRPSWHEILTVFRAAADGLAAAHDAKLVHRDFKPDNVLVARNGRVRVTDFGIARLAVDASDSATPTPPPAPSGPAGTSTPPLFPADSLLTQGAGTATSAFAPQTHLGATLAAPITREGKVVGTPRYMAPEQFANGRADFRTDQFSFAVALYEALYGQLPFAGGSSSERLQRAQRGEVQPPPASSHAPLWVHRIVTRALSPDPERRFESMRALGEALARDPNERRNRLLLGGAAVVAILLATIAVVRSGRAARAELCTGSERKLVGVWDAERRAQIRAAFLATKLPFAEDSVSRAEAVLDGYGAQWVATHREACEATSVRGEQAPQVLTLRMACLQQRLDAVAALTELFARADPGVVGKAKQSLDALPNLAACSDVARLTAKLPPPEDPKVAAEVERVRRQITRTNVLVNAGRYDEATAIAALLPAEAGATGYMPVQSEAELAATTAFSANGKFEEAVRLGRQAFEHALSIGYDEVLASSAVRLAHVASRKQQNERGKEWANLAESANQRARDPESGVLVENARGNIARNEGDFAGAALHYGRAMEEAKARLGAEHMTTLGVSYNHASTLQNVGRFRQATAEFAEVLATARRTLGPKHPFLNYPLISSGDLAVSRGDFSRAKALYQEAFELSGGKGMHAEGALVGLSDVALAEGRYEEALRHLQDAHAMQAARGPETVESLAALAKQGVVLARSGSAPRARALFEDVLTRAKGIENSFDAQYTSEAGLAELLLTAGRPAQAIEHGQKAVALLLKTRGKTHPLTLSARLGVAESHLALGRRDLALQEASDVAADARVELDDQHAISRRARALVARASESAKN